MVIEFLAPGVKINSREGLPKLFTSHRALDFSGVKLGRALTDAMSLPRNGSKQRKMIFADLSGVKLSFNPAKR
eukprot:7235459-Pyramimonas_sp.AAC.1